MMPVHVKSNDSKTASDITFSPNIIPDKITPKIGVWNLNIAIFMVRDGGITDVFLQ